MPKTERTPIESLQCRFNGVHDLDNKCQIFYLFPSDFLWTKNLFLSYFPIFSSFSLFCVPSQIFLVYNIKPCPFLCFSFRTVCWNFLYFILPSIKRPDPLNIAHNIFFPFFSQLTRKVGSHIKRETVGKFYRRLTKNWILTKDIEFRNYVDDKIGTNQKIKLRVRCQLMTQLSAM